MLSDKNGNFKFSSVLPGEYVLQVSYLGYVSWQKKIELKSDLFLQIDMTARSNKLKEVVITAAESPGIVSSSKIDRAAMAHLQPTSFADLLELLPGNISQTPNMGVANTITLRETGTLNASGEKATIPIILSPLWVLYSLSMELRLTVMPICSIFLRALTRVLPSIKEI